MSEPLACQGETIVGNMHGAVIITDAVLSLGMLIEVQVYLTGKKARATVVLKDALYRLYDDPAGQNESG